MKRLIYFSRFLRLFCITTTLLLSSLLKSQASTLTVTSANDTGPGTLRNQIAAAVPGDVIVFSSPFTINLASQILINKSDITIDATTVTGWSPSANKVTITGNGSTTNAFYTQTSPAPAPNLKIKGLIFMGFTSVCITLQDASNFSITNCWFGLLANGTSVTANTGMCISVKGTSSFGNIGTSNPLDRNIFITTSATASTCINLNNTGVSATQLISIQGNFFGTDYTGTMNLGLGVNSAIKSSNSGYVLIGGPGPSDGNKIEGCASGSGISFIGTTNFNFTIQGNKFGSVGANNKGISFGADNNSFNIIGNSFTNCSNVAIDMSASTTNDQIKISQNTFSNNSGGAINNSYPPPAITSATPTMVIGNGAGSGGIVEIYSWDGLTTSPQGSTYLASVTANTAGNWFYQGTFTVNQKLVAIATPASGTPSTTKFSPAFTVVPCPSSVNAGPDQTICATTASLNITGNAVSATAPTWTIASGGTGTISNANTYNPSYILSTSESSYTGPGPLLVTLKLTVNTATCDPFINDQMTITINPKPVSNAGTDQFICNSATGANLNGSVITATGGNWGTNGTGTFSPASNILNATYIPSAADKAAGIVSLNLNTTGNGLCLPSSDTMKLAITPAPTVNAGFDQTICANVNGVNLSGTVTVATGGAWSGGAGTFTPNANTLNATYFPTAAEKSSGSITLTLTSTGNGTCLPVADQMIITITPAPTTNAGPDQTMCANGSAINLSGTVTGATGVTWSGGTGAFSPSATTLNSSYTPSAAERTAQTATLTLTANKAGCLPVTDQINITITPAPTANAGPDKTMCANGNSVNLSGLVTVATGGAWSGGSGTFTPNTNTLNATYTPTAAEISSGSITLTLSTTGNGTCLPVTDQMKITITPAPTINAGPDQTICAIGSVVNLTGTVTVASGGTWTTNGSGIFSNPSSLNTTYTPSPADTIAKTVTLTLTSAGNGTCLPVTDQMKITITPAPVVNAGIDQSACVPSGNINLSGTILNSAGGLWTTSGAGTISNATLLNATYQPTSAESNTTVPLTITFTLVSNATGVCPSLTDQMRLTISPTPVVDAGADRTTCAANSNIQVSGNITGAAGGIWTTSGSGIFTNPNQLTTSYTPSNIDKTTGSVTLRLTSVGGNCSAVSDIMQLTINPCYIDPKLTFESPTLFKNNNSDPFKLNFSQLNSPGAFTYSVKKLSTLGATNCATIDANGFIKTTCVDTVLVTAYQAQKNNYAADTASFILYIGKAVTQIKLESHGSSVGGADFSLQVQTNYDQALTYSVVGGDLNAVSITTDGLITPIAVGTVYIRAAAAGSANYQAGTSNDAVVTIYPNLTKPVAINDTLELSIGETKLIDIGKNDYGTTASIYLPNGMLIDLDLENSGVQKKYFKPGVGVFTVDSVGVLTFTSFEAFIGVDSLQYTITDADGLVSKKANVVLYVNSPIQEIALKANEIITANNDRINDALVIGYTDLTQSNELLIVDAAGNRLFYTTNYQNNWYATDSNGNNLGNGVYYFIFRELKSNGDTKRQLKGNFTVIR